MLRPKNFIRNSKSLFRQYSKQFYLDNEAVRNLLAMQSQIVDSQQTFFEVNLGHVVHQFQRWMKLLPRIRPFYAVKCQPDQKVVDVLASMGAGFDCASQEEMHMAMKGLLKTLENSHGVYNQDREMSAESIVFANPFKFKQDMLYAQSNDIELTTFDSEGELYRLKKYWPSAKLLIRVSTKKLYKAKCQLGDKFGVKFENVEPLLKKAVELGFDIAGISFHVGNMCDDFNAWPDTVEYCFEIIKIMNNMGIHPHILDIGGGFPGLSSVITDTEINLQTRFEHMCNNLNSALDTYFSEKFTLIAEPGTYFVHGAYTLATEVIGKRKLQPHEYEQEFYIDYSIPSEDKVVKFGTMDAVYFEDPSNLHSAQLIEDKSDDTNRFIYILDDGVYGSFNILQFMEYRFILLAILNPSASIKNLVKDKNHVCKIYGPTCDTLDCVTPKSTLPELDVGDWLVWADMGAYTNASRSDFNGITRPNTFYYMSKEAKKIIVNGKEIWNWQLMQEK